MGLTILILIMREENLKKREIFENHYIQTELIVCSNINDHKKFSINLGFIKTSCLPLIIFPPYQQS